MSKEKPLISFEKSLDIKYGKKGSPRREVFDKKAKFFLRGDSVE